MPYPFEQWRAAIQGQPPLAADLPEWLTRLVTAARSGTVHEALNDPARKVPETNEEGEPPRYSAVLILLGGDPEYRPTAIHPFPEDATVVLTHRGVDMRTHSGQMAFPGGGWEDQDATPIDTAVREAVEETGLDPIGVEPLAVMDPVYIDRTNFAVVPVIAYWREYSPVHPATVENDWVHPVPISELVHPDYRFKLGFAGWSGPAFDVDGMVLWGFSAGVLDALLKLAGWTEEWDDETEFDLFRTLEQSRNGESRNLREQFTGGRKKTAGELRPK